MTARNTLQWDDCDVASPVEDRLPTTIDWSSALGKPPKRHLRVLPTITSLQSEVSSAEVVGVGQSIGAAIDNSSLSAILDGVWGKADQELGAYLELANGWDGYDGASFSAETVQLARDFLADLISACRQAEVIPLELYPGPVADGSVQIEAKVGDRYILGTFIAGSGDVGIYRECNDGDVEEQVEVGSSNLAARLAWLVGATSL